MSSMRQAPPTFRHNEPLFSGTSTYRLPSISFLRKRDHTDFFVACSAAFFFVNFTILCPFLVIHWLDLVEFMSFRNANALMNSLPAGGSTGARPSRGRQLKRGAERSLFLCRWRAARATTSEVSKVSNAALRRPGQLWARGLVCRFGCSSLPRRSCELSRVDSSSSSAASARRVFLLLHLYMFSWPAVCRLFSYAHALSKVCLLA